MCIRDRGDIDHGSALVGCDLLIHQVRCYAGRLYQDDRYAPPTGHVAAVSGGQSGPWSGQRKTYRRADVTDWQLMGPEPLSPVRARVRGGPWTDPMTT